MEGVDIRPACDQIHRRRIHHVRKYFEADETRDRIYEMRAVYECLLDFVLHLVDDSESGNRENHELLSIRDCGALIKFDRYGRAAASDGAVWSANRTQSHERIVADSLNCAINAKLPRNGVTGE